MKLLFVVDVGNSNITLGVYQGEDLVAKSRLVTRIKREPEEYGRAFLKFLQAENLEIEDIEAVVVSSVVTDIIEDFNSGVRKYLKKEPISIDSNTKTGISLRIDQPSELGSDRLVDAASAYYIYGGPVLIIDFGTATTYDIVTSSGEFMGGAISPGIKICAEAIEEKTSKLPQFEIKKPESILGKNTINSMQAGLFFGYVGQVEYIVTKFKELMGENLKVIATGGLSSIFEDNTCAIDIYDEDLTLKGLKYLYNKNH